MAGLGRKQWAGGELVTVGDMQGYLQDQTVMVFADAAARTAAIPSPTDGMVCWLKDIKQRQTFITSWVPTGGKLPYWFVRVTVPSLPAGWNVIAGTPVSSAVQGGATLNGSGHLVVPHTGVYAVTFRAAVGDAGAPVDIMAAVGVDGNEGPVGTGGSAVSRPGWTGSATQSILGVLSAGSVVAPRVYVSGAAGSTETVMTAQLVGLA